jgi:hypothetical protein
MDTGNAIGGLLTLQLGFSKLVLFQEIGGSAFHYFLLSVICADENHGHCLPADCMPLF